MLHSTPASALTETSILHTDGHRHRRGHTDGRTDRLIPVYPRKHSFWGGGGIMVQGDNNKLLLTKTIIYAI